MPSNNILKKLFLGLALFFLFFGIIVLIFSVVGLFYRQTVILSTIISIFLSAYICYKLPKTPELDTRKEKIFFALTLLVALMASFFSGYFTTPTVFGGRDQGALSTAAIELSDHHRYPFQTPLSQDLFKKYGPGKALNYPGFDYRSDGQLETRFPKGYVAYLGSAYSLFGLAGIKWANAPLLFIFLVLIFLILSAFMNSPTAFGGFLVAVSFAGFSWFSKYTLTETHMLAILWFAVYFLVIYF